MDNVKMIDKILIYGAGNRCQKLIKMLSTSSVVVAGIIDADAEKKWQYIEEYRIESKDSLCDYIDCFWCISVYDWKAYVDIKHELIDLYHMDEKKLIDYNAFFYYMLVNDINTVDELKKCGDCLGCFENDVKNRKVYFDLLNGMGLGGIEERVKMLVMNLNEKSNYNACIITNQDNYFYEEKNELTKYILRVNVNGEDYLTTIKNILDELKNKLPCTIITNQPNELMLAAYVIKANYPENIRIISIVSGSHERIYDEYLNLPIRSDLYIGVSEDIKRFFLEQGVTNVLSMKVPFPCDEILTRRYTLNQDAPIHIGYAGRLDGLQNSQKRMDLVLRLIDCLLNSKLNFVFEIAGEGPAELDMRKFVNKKDASERVIFCGRLSKKEMKSFWLRQDIGINLADYEGRSISVVEMMGAGAVPIVTDVSGVREDIDDGVNGFIIPIGDYKEAFYKIDYLYTHRELFLRMGQKAHDDIWPKSRMDKHLEFWDNVIRNIW